MPTERTDWDRYYDHPFWAARFTRRWTEGVLLRAIQRHGPPRPQGLVVAELGGASSCFHTAIMSALSPRQYHVIDNHQPSLRRMAQRLPPGSATILHDSDVLDFDQNLGADLVFSVGLIEHFEQDDSARAIRAHFRLAAPGGLVIITFPTPTFLYKMARRLAQSAGLWIFHDERPLPLAEVRERVAGQGQILQTGVIWPIVFTQGILVMRSQAQTANP